MTVQSEPQTVGPRSEVSVRTLATLGFGVYVSVTIPVAMSALMGEPVGASAWLDPLFLPAALGLFIMGKAAVINEEDRKNADLPRLK